jgi:hypothetical protein
MYAPYFHSSGIIAPMTTATAQACANIAFIKYRLAKLGRTNRKAGFGAQISLVGILVVQATKTFVSDVD